MVNEKKEVRYKRVFYLFFYLLLEKILSIIARLKKKIFRQSTQSADDNDN